MQTRSLSVPALWASAEGMDNSDTGMSVMLRMGSLNVCLNWPPDRFFNARAAVG